MAPSFHVGVSRREITCLVPGKGMMGWGDYNNTAQYVATPLYARAFVIADPAAHTKIVLVFAELCFISLALRREVLHRLAQTDCEIDPAQVVLLANHTHSNQGGYSDSPVYSLSIPGILPEVIAAYAAGIVAAIVEAHRQSRPMAIRLASAPFANDIPIGINRSIKAYNRNQDVTPVTEETRHLAMDRTMDLLRFDDDSGNLAGCITWFGLHGTSVKQTNHGINADNKGIAAQLLETKLNDQQKVVCAFAQTTAGDISPNTIKFRGERYFTGPSRDGYENSRFSGRLQAEHAAILLERAKMAAPLEGGLRSILREVDFSAVKVGAEFSEGVADARTGEGVLGPAFVGGTPDGGGVPRWAVRLLNAICTAKGLVDPAVHGEKRLLLQSQTHRILGLRKLPKVLDVLHPALKGLRLMLEQFRDGDKPWVPQVVPVQLVRIGPLLIAALPAEPTTVAGARIRTVLTAALSAAGINHVLIAGYANAYSGYITTREEYSAQCYEGGHTLFGQWTCAAYQTVLQELAQEFSAAKR